MQFASKKMVKEQKSRIIFQKIFSLTLLYSKGTGYGIADLAASDLSISNNCFYNNKNGNLYQCSSSNDDLQDPKTHNIFIWAPRPAVRRSKKNMKQLIEWKNSEKGCGGEHDNRNSFHSQHWKCIMLYWQQWG